MNNIPVLFRKKIVLFGIIIFILTNTAGFTFPQQELHSDDEAEHTEKTIPGPSDGPDAEKPEEDGSGENEFSYVISPPEISLDPIHTFTSTEAQIYTAIFEGLVTYHPFTLEPLPGIAERWEISKDKKTYTFFIRDNALYSNGEAILAEHFRDTWLTLIDPKQKAEYGSSIDMVKNAREYRTGAITDKNEVGIYAEGEKILKVELAHPAAHFLKVLCHHSFAPLHPAMLKNLSSISPEALISNGPFFIAEKGKDFLLMKKNQLYWDKDEVNLETLRILYSDDPQEITTLFNMGKAHWVDGNINIDVLQNQSAVVVNPLFSTSYFFFKAGETVFADPGIRRAIALLFPWMEIRSGEYMYLPADSLVPTFGSYPEVEGIQSRDVEEALRLLEEIGVPEGRGLPTIEIALPEGEESLRIGRLMQEAIQSNLQTEVEISQYPFHEYYDILKKKPFTIGTLNWIGDYADPLTFLQMWTSDSSLNLSEYRDSVYDELISTSMELRGTERYETLAEAEKHLLQGAIVMPIRNSPAFNIIDLQSIDGWFPNPLDIHPFKYVGFSKPTLPDGVVINSPNAADDREYYLSSLSR